MRVFMRLTAMSVALSTSPVAGRDFAKTFADPPVAVFTTTNHPDLKFCVITSISAKTGRASTVADRGSDTVVIIHNWTSAIAGDDVRGIFTIKADGKLEFRGQKTELIDLVRPCFDL